MGKQTEFKANGYVKSTYLDKQGAKHISLEFSAQDAVEIAKLELMSRDLISHMPVLMEVKIKVAKTQQGFTKRDRAPSRKKDIPGRQSAL